jgi:hypothetical protein
LGDALLNDIKTILTSFYITPNAMTYDAVKEVRKLFIDQGIATGRAIHGLINLAYVGAIANLNANLAMKVLNDAPNTKSYTALSAEQRKRFESVK